MDFEDLPYRCPKCGDSTTFSSLAQLRKHLDNRHSYRSPWSKRQLDYTLNQGRHSPLSDSFKKKTQELENQLKLAQETEERNRNERLRLQKPSTCNKNEKFWVTKKEYEPYKKASSYDKGVQSNYGSKGLSSIYNNSQLQNPPMSAAAAATVCVSVPAKTPYEEYQERLVRRPLEAQPAPPRPSAIDNYVSEILSKASAQMGALRQSSDTVVKEQRGEIERLRETLNIRDKQIAVANKELVLLTEEKIKLQREMLELSKVADGNKNELSKLKQQLEDKDKLIETKHAEIANLSSYLEQVSEQETAAKSRLEAYIAGLLERTQRAETELEDIKYRSLQPQLVPQKSHSDLNLQSANRHRDEEEDEYPARPHSAEGHRRTPYNQSQLNFTHPGATSTPYAHHTQPVRYPPVLSPYTSPREVGAYSPPPPHPRSPPRQPCCAGAGAGAPPVTPQQGSSRRRASLPDSGIATSVSSGPMPHRSGKGAAVTSPARPPRRSDSHKHKPRRAGSLSGGQPGTPSPSQQHTRSSGASSLPTTPTSRPAPLDSHGGRPDKRSGQNNTADPRSPAAPAAVQGLSEAEQTLWFCVFLQLDTRSLMEAARVCRGWRDVARNPALWRRLSISNARISAKFLKNLSKWSKQLRSLNFEGLTGRPRRPDETDEDYTKALWGICESGLEVLLQTNRASLRSFSILNCPHIFTERCVWLAGCHCPGLERLAYVSATDPVGAEVLYSLGAGARHIHTLIVPPVFPNDKPNKFNNRCLKTIARAWPELLVLNIGGVEVDKVGLEAIASGCSRLQVLELDHLGAVVDEATAAAMTRGAGLRGLTTLDFTFTPVTPKALIHLHGACARLASINVHLGIADYFEDIDDEQNQEDYREIVAKLKKLKSRPGLGQVLHLRTDYK